MLRQTTPQVIARKKDPEICAFSSVPFCVRFLGVLKICGMSHLNETTENRCIENRLCSMGSRDGVMFKLRT